jgi:hypothetical protein
MTLVEKFEAMFSERSFIPKKESENPLNPS